MFSRFIHVTVTRYGEVIFHCMETTLFVYSLVDGYLNYFHLFAMTNNAAVNTHVQALMWAYVVTSLECGITVCFPLWVPIRMLSTVATPFDTPASSGQGSHLLHVLPHTCYYGTWSLQPSWRVWVVWPHGGCGLWTPTALPPPLCAFPFLFHSHGSPHGFPALHQDRPLRALLTYCVVPRASQSRMLRGIPISCRVLCILLWGYKHTAVDLGLAFQSSFRQSRDCLTNETGIFIITCLCWVCSYFWTFVPAILLFHETLSASARWNGFLPCSFSVYYYQHSLGTNFLLGVCYLFGLLCVHTKNAYHIEQPQ